MCIKDALIIVINMGVFLSLFNMELISSFYPTEAKNKGVDEQTIGIIFSFHPVGWFLVSLAAGGVLVKPGMRKFLIKLSCGFAILGLLVLLLIKWVEELWIYITLASLARLFTGMVKKRDTPSKPSILTNFSLSFNICLTQTVFFHQGTGLFITPAYSYLPLMYRDTLE